MTCICIILWSEGFCLDAFGLLLAFIVGAGLHSGLHSMDSIESWRDLPSVSNVELNFKARRMNINVVGRAIASLRL